MKDLINFKLDDYCLQEVFLHLSFYDILNVQKVCKRWEELAQYRWRTLTNLTCDGEECYFSQIDNVPIHILRDTNDLDTTLKRCGPFITHLRLYRNDNDSNGDIFNNLLTTVTLHCYNLTEVSLIQFESDLSPITPIRPLLSCKNLESLTVGQINHEHEDDLSKILVNNKKLTYLRLDAVCKMTGTFLEYLPDNLESLDILICDDIEESLIISALERFNHLKYLEFYTLGELQDSILKVISQKEMLHILGLSGRTRRLPRMFDHLVNLVNLRELDLTDNDNLDDEALINICNNCQQLSSLSIDECKLLTDYGIAAVTDLRKLTELNMSVLANVTDKFIGHLSSTLESFNCCQCGEVEDHGLIQLLNRAPNLTLVDVSDCFRITNSFIEAAIRVVVRRSGDILEIDVRNCNVNIRELNKRYCQDVTKKIVLLRLIYNDSDDESNESEDCWYSLDDDDDSTDSEEFFD